jgi:hypothetical protein
MHDRTARIGFLETADAFLDLMADVERLPGAAFDTAQLSPWSRLRHSQPVDPPAEQRRRPGQSGLRAHTW